MFELTDFGIPKSELFLNEGQTPQKPEALQTWILPYDVLATLPST